MGYPEHLKMIAYQSEFTVDVKLAIKEY